MSSASMLPRVLAASSDINTGTDTTKVITSDTLAGSNLGAKSFCIVVKESDANTAVADGKSAFVVPASMNGMNIVAATASVHTAGTTNTTDIQIRRRRVTTDVDVLSTKITIDSTEQSSVTADAPLVINTSNDDLATGDNIYVDVDAISTTPATGLSVTITAQLP